MIEASQKDINAIEDLFKQFGDASQGQQYLTVMNAVAVFLATIVMYQPNAEEVIDSLCEHIKQTIRNNNNPPTRLN